MRKHYLRSAFTLGTSLTALFLLVRCSVPGRDYSQLGIGDSAGTGGLGGDDVLLGSSGTSGSGGQAGQDALGDAGSQGGSGGAPPPPPIPCTKPVDAGITDAGSSDAGSTDAGDPDGGSGDAGGPTEPCACVDGFIKAIDADGDGAGTRACLVAPGPDCDDDNTSVTHNGCGGCSTLPNAVGEDCLDCGAYICDGPDALVCATKPDAVVVDPDCQCQDALIVALDADQDGQGTRLCAQNPGTDCDDGDDTYVSNECGGCSSLLGAVGGACNQCGVYACINSNTLGCVPSTGSAGQRCLGDNLTRETCVGNGVWDYAETCVHPCVQGACAVCTPGTFRCTPYATGDGIEACFDSSGYGINWWYGGSCSGSTLICNPTDGTCHAYLVLPRDRTLNVVPSQRDGLPWHHLLNTALDSDYG